MTDKPPTPVKVKGISPPLCKICQPPRRHWLKEPHKR